MNTSVRLAQPSDIPAMHDIRLSVRENRLDRPDAISEASYLPYIENGSCWVALTDDRIAGFAAIDIANGTIWALFVAAQLEGRGIGKTLHKTLICAAEASGLKTIRLTTESGSRAASFYHAAGWKYVGRVGASTESIYELRLIS